MRKDTARGMALLVLGLASAATGCSEEEVAACATKAVISSQSCQVSADCAAAGLDLSCVDGVCRLPCRTDGDCDVVEAALDDDPACRPSAATTPVGICQAGLCEIGCPDAPCGANETCFDGRCVVYGEGFEGPEGADDVDLPLLGFNTPEPELPNKRTKVVFSGVAGCTPAVDLRCNGPAGQGVRFAVLETEPTPPKGPPVPGTTCRACACCLECLADPPDVPVSLAACPASPNVPTPLSCPASHPSCDAVCTQCLTCPDATATRPSVFGNPLLASCEKTAAGRRCGLCDACDAFVPQCQQNQCPACLSAPGSAECRTCVDTMCLSDQRCRECLTCADAQNCARTDPGAAQCIQLNEQCDLQGAQGCFNVPVDYLRAQLQDDEQAMTSPVIDLSEATGDLVLQIDYVAFDVGLSYFPGIQGTPPAQWTQTAQEVLVQFCSGDCQTWQTATLSTGGPARLPAADDRNNGRLLGDQTVIDWRTSRVTMPIAAELRTATFRYRLLPRLADGARLGVDNIQIRRVP